MMSIELTTYLYNIAEKSQPTVFWDFLKTIVSVFLGALIAYGFNIKKSSREKKLEHLAEIYLAAKNLHSCAVQFPAHVLYLISMQEGKLQPENIPKQPESPLPKISFLLDFCINASEELLSEINNFSDKIDESFSLIADKFKADKTEEELGKLNEYAFAKSLEARKSGETLSENLISWVKGEKLKIESEFNFTDLKHWFSLFKRIPRKHLNKEKNGSKGDV